MHNAWFLMIGLGLWVFDLSLRLGMFIIYKRKLKNAYLTNLPGNVIRCVFEMKPEEKFRYKSGQYVCICIPEISCFEWHPLSISSSPHENEFSLHFSAIGRWTKKVQSTITQKGKFLSKEQQSYLESNFKSIIRKNTFQSNIRFQSKMSKLSKNSETSKNNYNSEKQNLKNKNNLKKKISMDINSKIHFKPKFDTSYISMNFHKKQKYFKTKSNFIILNKLN